MQKIELGKMTLGEQDVWEKLAGCSLTDIQKLGLTGRRMAALLYIFAKREDANVQFEKFLNMDMEEATSYLADEDEDPKE